MRAIDIIEKKRDRLELTREELEYFVQGYTRGDIPDYQAAAWAMAVLLNGMTQRETTDLTLALAHSGEILDVSAVVPIAVDKHSTGGVGDKTTLVVAPVVSACGLPVGKMSGRGLGFSGGTLDKLESIPGFHSDLTSTEFLEQLGSLGIVVSGQTEDLAPADGKLYALRDVTGTVESIPLIASSVMSKKIASGAQAIVLDVKLGLGAFMSSMEDARSLAELMVSIARLAGRKAVGLLSDMNQPLGYAVGNALEIKEAVQTLHGNGPADFHEHCLVVAGHMLALGGIAPDEDLGLKMAQGAIDDGRGWEQFKALIAAQGGDINYIENLTRLPFASLVEVVPSPREAYLREINARIVGECSVTLGAGRVKKGDLIDPAVGIIIHHKVGDYLQTGEALFTIHANDQTRLEETRQCLLDAHKWSETPVEPLPLFYGVVKS